MTDRSADRAARRSPPPLGSLLLFWVVLMLWSVPAVAQDAPTTVVRGFYDTLLSTMKQGPQLGFQGRFDRIRPAFEQAFNAPLMTQVVVGPAWAQTPDDLKRKAIDAFTRFSVATYAANFRDFSGERFEIQGTRPLPQGTVVDTRIVPPSGEPTPISFLLRPTDAGPRIADVFLDRTISELATRRADFAQTIRTQGVDGLVSALDAKARQIAAVARS